MADTENILFRLEAAIVAEQLALREELRHARDAEGRDAKAVTTAQALAHLHRHTLGILLTVHHGSWDRETLMLPCMEEDSNGVGA